jgi:hypothetical protein
MTDSPRATSASAASNSKASVRRRSTRRRTYHALGLIGATFRELGWKTLIFFKRAVPTSPNASHGARGFSCGMEARLRILVSRFPLRRDSPQLGSNRRRWVPWNGHAGPPRSGPSPRWPLHDAWPSCRSISRSYTYYLLLFTAVRFRLDIFTTNGESKGVSMHEPHPRKMRPPRGGPDLDAALPALLEGHRRLLRRRRGDLSATKTCSRPDPQHLHTV